VVINIFAWSVIGLFEMFVYIFSLCFFISFVIKKDIDLNYKIILGLILLPILIFEMFYNVINYFDIDECNGYYNLFYTTYIYLFELLSALFVVFWGIWKAKMVKTSDEKRQIIFITTAVFLFQILFTLSSVIGEATLIYGINLFGPIGLVIFVGLLSFLIVHYKAFDIKLLGAQALVWVLIIIIGSEFFFIQNNTNRILTAITLVISAIVGLIIIRSVKKEIAQKEYIEKIAIELKRLNDDKSEFVSFASHQIRTPLTSIKGYSAEILEGDYGEITPELKDAIQKILVRGTDAVTLISQYLDKSKMELGQLKYDFTDFDIVELAKSVTKGFEPNAEQSKLTLKFSTTEISPCLVNADKGKVKEVIGNLIDNAIKYTPSGSIEVSVFKKDDKVLVKFSDTGVGMSKEVIADLYKKFGRAKDAAKTNILGTGLGLFLAKTFMEAMKGRSWAESEGDGKGSQFYVELPAKS
jgi:signal transduction histidine kinase